VVTDTAGDGGVSLSPTSADTDADASEYSIFINRTGTSGGLAKLQADGSDVFVIDRSGNVTTDGTLAVGYSSAEQQLDVNGNVLLGQSDGTRYIYFDNGTANNAGFRYNSTTDTVQYSHDGSTWADVGSGGTNYWTQSGTDIYYTTGNVGIGTSTPNAKLDIAGASSTISNSSGDITLNSASGNISFSGDDLTNIGSAYVSSNIGVNDTTPSYNVDVNGTLRAYGITDSSDVTLKKNIENLNSTLDKVLQLRGVTFDWKNPAYGTSSQIGLIAQEIEEYFPELVSTDSSGLKSIAYGKLTAVLVEAIKEQQQLLGPITVSDEGYLSIDGQDTYNLVYDNGVVAQSINAIAGFNRAVIAQLRAGSINTQELIADNITVAGQSLQSYVQNIVDQTIASLPDNYFGGNDELISPTPGEDLVINLDQTPEGDSSTLQVTDENDQAVLTIDNNGNVVTQGKITAQEVESTGQSKLGDLLVTGDATVSGTVTAESVQTEQVDAASARLDYLEGQVAQFKEVKATTLQVTDATISGTLVADSISDFDQKIAQAFEQPSLINTILGRVNETEPFAGFELDAANAEALNLTLADLELEVEDVAINASALFINDYFKVNGSGYVAGSLGVGQNLVVGDGIQIGNGAIAYRPTSPDANDTFYIQPDRVGTLSFLGNLMTLTADGQVTIDGDLRVAGSVDVAGNIKTEKSLLTNLIEQTDPNQPVQIKLAEEASQSGQVNNSRFEITDQLGTPVATISASGRANFSGVGVDTGSIQTTSPGVFVTTKTAGKAYIPAGLDSVTIKSEDITEDTLIYVTPLNSTNNQVMYVSQQNPEDPKTLTKEGNFVVSLDFALTQEVQFNWWMVQ
jgi:hypothetical protein